MNCTKNLAEPPLEGELTAWALPRGRRPEVIPDIKTKVSLIFKVGDQSGASSSGLSFIPHLHIMLIHLVAPLSLWYYFLKRGLTSQEG